MSDDGRFVAFRSRAALVPEDTNDDDDVYVKDMQTGVVELASASSSGATGNGTSGSVTLDISADGRYVLFNSAATNLDTDTPGAHSKLFVRDRQAGTTEVIRRSDGSAPGNTRHGAISADGRYVAFHGPSGAVVGELAGMIVLDRQTDTFSRLSEGPFAGNYEGMATAISDNGRYVAFLTSATADRDAIWYDTETDEWKVANPRIGGQAPQSRIHDLSLSMSGNGRYVAFQTEDNNLVPGDPAGTHDVFVFDSQTGGLERIASHGANGYIRQPLSADGRYVAFATTNPAWTPAGSEAVVVYDRNTDTAETVSPYDTAGSGGPYSTGPAMSRNGRYVAFYTGFGFDPADTTGNDVYITDREGTPGGGGDGCTHTLTDIDGNTFEDDICWLAAEGITRGCNPPANTRFCPDDRVKRGQMAAFLVRALDLTQTGPAFSDTGGNTFESDISRLAAAGITRGCNPPANTQFCPDQPVTRGQMAAFLRRALG